MPLTDYHSQYLAHELTRRHAANSAEKLAGALVDAQVELNPHQVEAALFAFNSPLTKGALLADEVGLGKTIEAGLVISQKWAERKRRILVITPANLRKQWQQELSEKFFLPCRILERKTYHDLRKQGAKAPFEAPDIVICSYQFARAKTHDIQLMRWDLVVLDEAHRLRNVYKPANVIANTLKRALANCPKLLLTATPLQNSLLELYGLMSFIDDHIFGDVRSFREQFGNLNDRRIFNTLKNRISPFCHRTLRKQVSAYVSYTKRLPMLEEFTPDHSEERLYEAVSEYLQRDNLQALPNSQRALITLVLRKLLASSTFAIAGALDTMIKRLKKRVAVPNAPQHDLETALDQDFEALDEMAEEWSQEDTDQPDLSSDDIKAIQHEIADLEEFYALAVSIHQNSKGKALLTALEKAFKQAQNNGAPQKALIFTESRRTQDYLLRLFEDTPYKGKVVLFNGSNNDAQSNQIYRDWAKRHQGSDKVTGSKTADMRSALVDYFRDSAQIMIATEAGAEGINLQFCATVVNYDLPWNPQRIEQRIGRCHRYGQKHDVVVLNFVNLRNAADQRVYQLLMQKFHLFEGVFGASDEVLGSIESGVDFEMRIAAIYQQCRSSEQITAAFDQLQHDLSMEINEQVQRTRQQLLDNFDEEVTHKLKQRQADSMAMLNAYEQKLLNVTQHELREYASFEGEGAFELRRLPNTVQAELGRYELPRRNGEAHTYRLGHPLAEYVLRQAQGRTLPPAQIALDLSGRKPRLMALERYIGQTGLLQVSLFETRAPANQEVQETHVICAAMTDSGELLEGELAAKLLTIEAMTTVTPSITLAAADLAVIKAQTQQHIGLIRGEIQKRNQAFFDEAAAKLDGWADDQKESLERDIKALDAEIKEARRAAAAAYSLEGKLAAQKHLKELETKRKQQRRALFDAEDEIERRREALIEQIQTQLQGQEAHKALFVVKWMMM